jgi:hypothetical protein
MINAETGYCTFPNCPDKEDRQGFCIGHARHFAGAKPSKEQKKIAARSDKRVKDQKEYVKIVKSMLSENPNCEIKMEGCQTKATGLHHKQKRGPKNFLDRANLMRACNNCQLFVELNSKTSLSKGLTISRFKPCT